VLGLTVVTGFTALVYEVTWQRYVAILLGSDSESTAAVLGLFLGGLALGYELFGAWTRRIVAPRAGRRLPSLLTLYGVVEFLIGLLALAFPWIFSALRAVSLRIPSSGEATSFAVDVMLTALLVGPPAILMGATIPMLTQGLSRSLEESTRIHARVYGLNTAGAFCGALAAGFWLIPELGLVTTVRAMGVMNVAVGLLLAGLGALGASRVSPQETSEALLSRPIRGYRSLVGAALLSGFAMMSLQTVFIRLGALALGASHFTFSIVVATFVFAIALGSLTVSRLERIPRIAAAASQWLLAALLVGLYVFVVHWNYGAHVLRTLFQQTDAAFVAFHFSVFLCVLAILAIPIGLSGALLPLLFHTLRREVGELGAVSGRLYSWNTLGSLLGALLGGYLLLFWVNLHVVFRVASAAVALSALLLSLRLMRTRRRVVPVAFASFFGVIAVLPPWPERVLAMGAFMISPKVEGSHLGSAQFTETRMRDLEVLFHDDGPTGSATVLESGGAREFSRSLVINGKTDGDSRQDYLTTSLLGLVPALLAEPAERMFVVGYGLGITAGELAALDSTREVVVAEISRSVLRAAPSFDEFNLGARTNPKVRIVRGDAYRTLLRSEGLYDVIVSEPSNPWVLGVEMVYSREFLEQARGRLGPNGVYAQWIHRYDVDPATLALVLSTYASVFEDISVWYTVDYDLIFLGFNSSGDSIPLERIAQRAAQPDFREALARVGLSDLSGLLAHEVVPVGVISREHVPDRLHTLYHPRLSYAAARAFFRRPPPVRIPRVLSNDALYRGGRNSLARRHAATLDAQELELHRAYMADETCKHLAAECRVLLGEWIAENPGSATAQAMIAPLEIRAGLAQAVSAGDPRSLSILFEQSGRALPGSLAPSDAQALANAFFALYHYAAPFPPEILSEIWRRCSDPAEAQCQAGLARAMERLGSR
jgi:spermidine synthase